MVRARIVVRFAANARVRVGLGLWLNPDSPERKISNKLN